MPFFGRWFGDKQAASGKSDQGGDGGGGGDDGGAVEGNGKPETKDAVGA